MYKGVSVVFSSFNEEPLQHSGMVLKTYVRLYFFPGFSGNFMFWKENLPVPFRVLMQTCLYIITNQQKWQILVIFLFEMYYHRKWTQLPLFESWVRLFAFHVALIPLGKLWIQVFSLLLWGNGRADYVL